MAPAGGSSSGKLRFELLQKPASLADCNIVMQDGWSLVTQPRLRFENSTCCLQQFLPQVTDHGILLLTLLPTSAAHSWGSSMTMYLTCTNIIPFRLVVHALC